MLRGYVSGYGACGDCGGTTSHSWIEILEFQHFTKIQKFEYSKGKGNTKAILNQVTVIVALDVGYGNTNECN